MISFAPRVAPREATPAERALAAAQAEYDAQGAIYAASHPRMQLLSRQIAKLQAQVQAELNLTTGQGQSDGEAIQNQNPAVFDLKRQKAEARLRIEEIDRALDLIAGRKTDFLAEEKALTESIRITPEIELSLNGLLREQVDLQAQYEQVVRKLAEAEIGAQLELNSQSERFRVIERAEPPSSPEKPNRLLILAAGVVASVGAGVSLVILVELMNKTIRTVGDLERTLDAHAFATIPYITTGRDIRRRWIAWVTGLAAFAGLGAGAAYAVDKYYLPLEVVVEKVVDRTGVKRIADAVQRRVDQ